MANPAVAGPPATLPLAVALAVAPVAAVLQSKALAPIAVLALGGCVLLHRRRHGAWLWPVAHAAWIALSLFGWAAITAVWSLEPGRALGTAVQLGGFVLLGAAAARAVAAADDRAKARMLLAATAGLVLGLATAAIDAATGNAVRAAVRGLATAPPQLAFGLKPAASAMALWLPLVGAAPLPRWLRGLILGAGTLVLLALPGETAKLAAMLALLVGGLALAAPRLGPSVVAGAIAVAILVMPAALGPLLARGVPLQSWPPSAAHRVLIWDFVTDRIAERPSLGWGLEASRSIPGHASSPDAAQLSRFGLTDPARAGWIPSAHLLPLHPHNGSLQIWLELGAPGALLAAWLAWALGAAARRSAAPAVAAAMLASGAVTAMLSFGAWQEWWVGTLLLAVAAVAALPDGSAADDAGMARRLR